MICRSNKELQLFYNVNIFTYIVVYFKLHLFDWKYSKKQ